MNGPPPADTLLAALTRLAALEPAQAALCADGHSWCTRAELLAWARAAACPEPPAVEVSGPRPWVGRVAARDVPAADPLGAVLALVAAEDARSVPVVRDPDWPAEIVAAQVALAERLGGSWPADPGEPAAVLAVGVPEHVLVGGWDAASLLVLPTSGSSAVPRLVVRTARSWLDSLAPFSAVTGIGREDVVWAPGPPAATLTLFAIWHALAGGLPVIASGRWRGVVPAGPVAAEADVV
ncbi:MAG TPA: hypothetical protein VFP72_19805, partial [Kineosporiaceae bacterium]|nr:hypothetical protein [Kineosporiaceae bacterium]